MSSLPCLPTSEGEEGNVLVLLRAGIPLTLLMDLAGPDPHSDELYTLEKAS